jgi:hypothetical protein
MGLFFGSSKGIPGHLFHGERVSDRRIVESVVVVAGAATLRWKEFYR